MLWIQFVFDEQVSINLEKKLFVKTCLKMTSPSFVFDFLPKRRKWS